MLTTGMKLSELIDADYSLLQVISRTGLDLRYAGMSVSEACRACGIDADTFILICNVYSFPDHVPSQAELAGGNIQDIIGYLHSSHLHYMGMAISSLEKAIDALVAPCDEKQKKVVLKFFTDYKNELDKHFAYEENVVFPYVEALLDGKGGTEYSIEQFQEHHENVEEKLEDLKNIVMLYLPTECAQQPRIAALLSICHFRDDLRRHTYVEDNILVPIVSSLERNGR